MENFVFLIGTTAAFGKGQLEKLPGFVRSFGSRVLFVYGGRQIKRTGLYDRIVNMFRSENIEWFELSGVQPNPDIADVRRGAEICAHHDIDVVLAVGGGSCMDCAKAISAAALSPMDAWELTVNSVTAIQKTLPVIAVPTTAATGSEMDCNFVISNHQTGEKICGASLLTRPRFAILDPTLTFTVPAYQTAAGSADILSHLMEIYFNGNTQAFLEERMLEAAMKTVVHFAPLAISEPENYEARANLMWASCLAINGVMGYGKSGMWPIHTMEPPLHKYQTMTHGHVLAAITPSWMRYVLCDKTYEMFAVYGRNVFDLEPTGNTEKDAENAIDATERFYEKLGLSKGLKSLGFPSDFDFREAAQRAAQDGLENCFVPLSAADTEAIYKAAL